MRRGDLGDTHAPQGHVLGITASGGAILEIALVVPKILTKRSEHVSAQSPTQGHLETPPRPCEAVHMAGTDLAA